MPDKNGKKLRVGDRVLTDRGPREGYEGGSLARKTGLLDLDHSSVNLLIEGGASDWPSHFFAVGTANLRRDVQWGQAPEKLVKVDVTPAQRLWREVELADMEIAAIQQAELDLATRKQKVERMRERLLVEAKEES